MEQEDVTTTAETTVEPTSSVDEATETTGQGQETEEIADTTSADTTVEPAKVSESVPYDRFREVNEAKAKAEAEARQLKDLLAASQVPTQESPAVEFDPDTKNAIQAEINQGIVNHKIAEFRTKHGDELAKDDLLSIAVEREMRKQSSQGLIIDPDLAYSNAKDSLSKLVQPKVDEAKEAGVKEGQDIAKTKQQLGAVGEPGAQPDVDEEKLSAADYAKLHNIPYVPKETTIRH